MNFWNFVSNNYQWLSEKSIPRKVIGIPDLDPLTNLAVQMMTLSKQLDKLNVNYIQTNVVCDHCARNHVSTKYIQSQLEESPKCFME